MGYVVPHSDDDLQICHAPSHYIRLRGLEYLVVQQSQKQTAANSEILSHFYNKGLQNSFTRVSISNCRNNAHGSKTENHVGASMVAVKGSREIHINTQRLSIMCTVFQAELYGISMAVDWTQSQGKKTSSYATNVDSKAALLAIVNKHTTHPLAVATRFKTIELRNSTSITFHWVKGHAGLKGNKRAD